MAADRVCSRNPWHLGWIIDDSGSMAGQPAIDVNKALTCAIDEMIAKSGGLKPYFRNTIVAYGSSPEVLCEGVSETALDVDKVASFSGARGSTDIAAALDEMRAVLKRNPGKPSDFVTFVFLLSDGHADDEAAAIAAAERLKQLSLPEGAPRIVAFGFDKANDETMKKIASTAELYKRLTSSKDITRVFPLIGSDISDADGGAAGVERAIINLFNTQWLDPTLRRCNRGHELWEPDARVLNL